MLEPWRNFRHWFVNGQSIRAISDWLTGTVNSFHIIIAEETTSTIENDKALPQKSLYNPAQTAGIAGQFHIPNGAHRLTGRFALSVYGAFIINDARGTARFQFLIGN